MRNEPTVLLTIITRSEPAVGTVSGAVGHKCGVLVRCAPVKMHRMVRVAAVFASVLSCTAEFSNNTPSQVRG